MTGNAQSNGSSSLEIAQSNQVFFFSKIFVRNFLTRHTCYYFYSKLNNTVIRIRLWPCINGQCRRRKGQHHTKLAILFISCGISSESNVRDVYKVNCLDHDSNLFRALIKILCGRWKVFSLCLTCYSLCN